MSKTAIVMHSCPNEKWDGGLYEDFIPQKSEIINVIDFTWGQEGLWIKTHYDGEYFFPEQYLIFANIKEDNDPF